MINSNAVDDKAYLNKCDFLVYKKLGSSFWSKVAKEKFYMYVSSVL